MIYLGLKGNEIACKTRPYKDLEEFKKNQKIWAWAAPILWLVSFISTFVIFGAAMFMGAMR